jgi:hypothetical protein
MPSFRCAEQAVAEAIRSKLQMDPIGSTASEAAKTFADDAKLWATVMSGRTSRWIEWPRARSSRSLSPFRGRGLG